MPKRSDAKREAGFSLVEALCAVAIAASAIAVLTSGIGGSLKGAQSLDKHLGARILLQSILEDELASDTTAPALREGDSAGYRWRLEIAPADVVDGLPAPYVTYRLTATAMWEPGGRLSAEALKLGK
ncbi:MAG: prepilin-type N-terminal cleavage/methylation domain-containing protein [Aestuariivirga sp.]|uniref:prepilin-type N-terminal cleavage/methylation domain-containing protein n=1 Tax=Aestuariivirga sp. TaxID=2650926 RepID=UPI0038CFA1C1